MRDLSGRLVIPISKVVLGPEEEQLVVDVLRSGMLAQGVVVEQFEQLCASMAGTDHAVAVSNGTVALSIALEALQLRAGDEILTTPFTFVATLNAALESGATVRFVDISAADFNMAPDHAEEMADERTAALLPVHLYGQAADVESLGRIASRWGALIVEDAAQAHGATLHGRPVGSSGLATFSFYATKNLMCGEGGVVTTDSADLADRMRVLRNQGMRARYDYVLPGHNYRLSDLAAAVAVPQFARLDSIVEARRANADYFGSRLRGLPGIVVPEVLDGRGHVWHQYTLRVTDEAPVSRDVFVQRLHDLGVGAGVYYPRLVHDYACFRDHPRIVPGDTPVAGRVAREVVSIPVHQHLSEQERHAVADAVIRAVGTER